MPAPEAAGGVLDLRGWSFPRDGIVDLAGEWDFAWGRFEDPASDAPAGGTGHTIRVPASWNDAGAAGKPPGAQGYGTYRLRVECRESARLALLMPTQHSAVRLYVNGRVLVEQGSPGASREQARPAFVQQVAPLGDAACPLRIVAHVSNYDMRIGGLLRSLELGTERQMTERRERGLARDLFSLGGLVVLSLLPVFVFLWRREDRAPLWLGLYGLSSAAFVGIGGERLFQPLIAPLGWQAAWKIAFLFLLAGVAAFPAFLRALYPEAFPRALLRAMLATAGALALLVLATPTHVFTQATPVLYALSAAVGASAVAVQVRVALQGRRGAWLLLAGTAVLIGTSVHDTVQIAHQVADKLTPYGLLVFALAPVLLLAQRFARALKAEELRTVEQQQRVDLLVNATKAGLLDTDVVAKHTGYSERLKEMLGYARDADSSGWPPFLELTHPEDRERIRASFAAQMRDRSVKSGVRRWTDSPDFRVRRADGSYVWVKGEAISLTGADGRTLRQICSFVDISERKRQELELRDQMALTRALIAENPNAMYLKDLEGRYLTVNDAWLEMVGVTREQAIGRNVLELFPEKESERYHAEDMRLLRQGAGMSEVESLRTGPGGKPQWVIVRKAVLRRADGAVAGLIGTNTDITKLKNYEAELARERERLALLVRSTKAGFMDWDAASDTRVYSERFKEMLGYPPDADTSAWPPLFDMMHPEDREPMRAAFRDMLRQGAATGERIHGPLEYRLRKADGSYLWVRGEGIAQIGADGRTERFLTSYIDITHLREMNLALEESVRLREEVDRISRHDLKTPLNSIIGIPRLLRDSGRLSAEDGELLAFVEQAGYRLLGMVNLSLDMLRMEQGSYPFQPQAVDVLELLRKVARDLERHAASRRVTIAVEGPRLGARGEELLCYSMLANLVKNAVEASPEGGTVRIAVADAGAEQMRITIHNAGEVPEAMRARFFQKYATAGKSGGSGLGSYSARLMARTQQGDIAMRSSAAEGTTLTVTLRTATEADRAATERSKGAPVPEAKVPAAPALPMAVSVLVVDDDAYSRAFIRRLLPAAAQVAEAADGREALAKAAAAPPELILMDLDMPVMGGLEAAAAWREREREAGGGRIAMVAMSSHDGVEIRQRALDAGFDLYLEKPVSPEALRRALAALLGAPGPADAVPVKAMLQKALPGFLESRRELLRELERALAAGRAEPARALAHKLAGGFALYGFRWAAGQGKLIERRAAEGALEGLEALVAALHRHLDAVRVEILE